MSEKMEEYEKQWDYYKELPVGVKAYIAGIIDGEGCIRSEETRSFAQPRIIVKMTCKKTIEFLREHLNCSFREVNRTSSFKEHWKDQFLVDLSGHQASKLLEAIHPFMITKKELAVRMSEFYITSCSVCSNKFWKVSRGKYCSHKCRKHKYNTVARAKRDEKC